MPATCNFVVFLVIGIHVNTEQVLPDDMAFAEIVAFHRSRLRVS